VWIPVLELADQTAPNLGSLREVVIGGSACPPALMRAFEDRHGVRVLHAWGMTETSPLGAVARAPSTASTDDERWAYRVTQGRLPLSVEGRIVADDGTVLASDGVAVGELEVRGPWVTGSYYRDDSAEASSRFHDGWLRTGDVGTLTADGYLTLTDRAKDVVKSGGEWISTVALENELMGHDGVREAAVIAVPDARWGERPFAVVVRAGGTEGVPADGPTVEQLRALLSDRFAGWQVPDHWAWVGELPHTAAGKVDKKVLRAAHAAGTLTPL
jgi:fatty-acyl-CoA synthase